MPRKRRFRKSNPWWTRKLTIAKKKYIGYVVFFRKGERNLLIFGYCRSIVLCKGSTVGR